MGISFQNYVDITSGVIAGNTVSARDLIIRVFTDNPLVPTNSFAEFDNAADVGTYFGLNSIEYARAAFNFSFVSKLVTTPQKISFAAWSPNGQAGMIYGDPTATGNLAALQAVTAGTLNLTLGATTATVTGIDFAAAGNLAAVAAALQVAIRAAEPSVADWSGATVVYNALLPQGAAFVITGGVVGGAIAVANGMGTCAGVLGLLGGNTVVSQGVTAQTPDVAIAASVSASNNFSSYLFMHANGTAFGSDNIAEITELAAWQATQNISFKFLLAVAPNGASPIAASVVSPLVIGVAGVEMTIAQLAAEFPEMVPGMIMAATDYTRANASQSYMYQQVAGLTPSVTNDADRTTYNALRVNYYGQTQDNGQTLAFYQQGVTCGPSSSPTDMNAYSNEIWLKAFAGSSFIAFLLNVPEVPTNAQGRGLLLAVLRQIVIAAVNNGTISTGNTFTQAQQLAVTTITGAPNAWQQVQASGYWYDVTFSSNVVDGITIWQANYILVYAKKNDIRKIVGTHALV